MLTRSHRGSALLMTVSVAAVIIPNEAKDGWPSGRAKRSVVAMLFRMTRVRTAIPTRAIRRDMEFVLRSGRSGTF